MTEDLHSIGLNLKATVARLEGLSELPGLLARLIQGLSNKAQSAQTIESCPVLAAGLLHLAGQRGLDPGLVGYSIRQIVDRLDQQDLLDWLISIEPYAGPHGPALSQIILHSLAVANAARRLAEASPIGIDPDLAYIAGLLHDIGKIALLQIMPKGVEQLVTQAKDRGLSSYQLERQYLGTDHAAIGRLLASRWHIQDQIQQAIWLHHCPAGATSRQSILARFVATADHLARSAGVGNSGSFDQPMVTGQMAGWLGLDMEVVNSIRAHLRSIHTRLADLVGEGSWQWQTFGQAVRLQATRLLQTCKQQAEAKRQQEALAGLVRLIKDIAIAINQATDAAALSGMLCRAWQHHYQAARVCILCKPIGHEGPVDLTFVGGLGGVIQGQIEDPEIVELVSRSAAARFEIYDDQALLQALAMHLDQDWKAGHTHWIPLCGPGMGIGVLVFELNYELDLDRFIDQLQLSAELAGAGLYLLYWGLEQQQQAEQMAGLLAEISTVKVQDQMDLRQALAEVASGLAHELNNPLAVISARAQLLAESVQDQQVRRSCQQIQQQAQQLAGLVEGLMGYAEPTAPRRTPTSFQQVLDEASELVKQRLGRDQLDLAVQVPSDLPPLFVDSAQVASALANLLINAFQSYPDAKGKVSIRVQPSGQVAKLQISDNGCGMDQQTLIKATLPFFSSRPAGRQTGLGLAFADRLIGLNDGTMRIWSQPGVGTTVDIELPVVA